jgi:LemA protein
VLSYNTKTQQFPSVIFANMFGFQPAEFFEAEEGARADVKVSFSPAPPAPSS